MTLSSIIICILEAWICNGPITVGSTDKIVVGVRDLGAEWRPHPAVMFRVLVFHLP